MNRINLIVIHCADTPNGRADTAEDIHRWHLDRGWSGIGYHYVIGIDGTVQNGRPEYWQGAHVAGHNANSIGVCLIGRDLFTNEQTAALQDLLAVLRDDYPEASIRGHYELDPGKTCPNIDVPAWLDARGIERL